MTPFVVCIHDVTPAFACQTERMLRDLAPLVGRRLALGVVPDWHGTWPLAAHRGFCDLVRDAADERLLHGWVHRRERGAGMATLLTGGSDEMNGLGVSETRAAIARGQEMLADVFGEPARGFLAPAWQRGHVRTSYATSFGLAHTLGFFSLDEGTGRRVPLATWTWDCARWSWLGHVGHGVGSLLHRLGRRVPTLAIHPQDLARGYWPGILRLTRRLLDAGYQPATPAGLLQARR